MHMPGFNADASLYRTSRHFRMIGALRQTVGITSHRPRGSNHPAVFPVWLLSITAVYLHGSAVLLSEYTGRQDLWLAELFTKPPSVDGSQNRS